MSISHDQNFAVTQLPAIVPSDRAKHVLQKWFSVEKCFLARASDRLKSKTKTKNILPALNLLYSKTQYVSISPDQNFAVTQLPAIVPSDTAKHVLQYWFLVEKCFLPRASDCLKSKTKMKNILSALNLLCFKTQYVSISRDQNFAVTQLPAIVLSDRAKHVLQ